jgi:hypothetical protein
MTTNNNFPAMSATPPHRGGGWEGVYFIAYDAEDNNTWPFIAK